LLKCFHVYVIVMSFRR